MNRFRKIGAYFKSDGDTDLLTTGVAVADPVPAVDDYGNEYDNNDYNNDYEGGEKEGTGFIDLE